jgi:hypothetical protein
MKKISADREREFFIGSEEQRIPSGCVRSEIFGMHVQPNFDLTVLTLTLYD